jgi:hypothetical protein
MICALRSSPAYSNLEPGGYLELQDFFFPVCCFTNPNLDPESAPFMFWSQLLVETALKLGLGMIHGTYPPQ